MFHIVLAEGHEIHSLIDLIPGIHEFWQQFGSLGHTWLKGNEVSFIHVALSLLSVVVIGILIAASWKKFKPTPDAKLTPRTFFELIIDALYSLMTEQLHSKERARTYLPLVLGLAVFIFFNNAFALIPGLAPATDNLNTNVGMALIVFFVSTIAGIHAKGIGKVLKEMCGPMPILAPLMFPIELLSQLARPVSLTLRLMGNMYGDHSVVAVFTILVAAGLPSVMMCLGTLVVVIQTAVFCILTVVYISMAVTEE